MDKKKAAKLALICLAAAAGAAAASGLLPQGVSAALTAISGMLGML